MATDEDPNEAKKMPLLDHLIELRQRLFYAALGLLVAFIGCWFVSQHILNFLLQPLNDAWMNQYGTRLPEVVYTNLTEAFFTRVKLSFFGAIVVAFPIIAGQLWAFVAPGLYKHEKSAFLPFLAATPILFLMGSALLYYVLLPVAWKFFISFQTAGGPDQAPIQLLPKVSEYVTLVMQLIFAFGFCFQMPVLLTLLTRVGIITSDTLKQKRRYAIVIVFIVAAIVTPPDPISQCTLALPLLVLYEASVWLSVMVERNRDKREKEEREKREKELSGDDPNIQKRSTAAPV
ncbi:MAG TPA: twin-arginine translocase subunit TatC [Methylomirabilota bacterium]|nr:twin-arginine translocase subunit TatC [Methylomirabilota bacterium]